MKDMIIDIDFLSDLFSRNGITVQKEAAHDDLWENPDEPFCDMLVPLKMGLTDFLSMAFSGEDYPIDALSAERFTESRNALPPDSAV